MNCCQCQGIEDCFDDSLSVHDLRHYQRHGPAHGTRLLLDALKAHGISGATLLDIGGGIGAIQHELLRDGVASAIHVDAASAYLAASKNEAQRLGHIDRVTYYHGDFVDLATTIPAADIVTLDRVICCYHDMPALIQASAARTGRLYGLVFPRDVWWAKVGVRLLNIGMRVRGDSMRVFVHPTQQVDALLRQHGLERRFYRRTIFWQVMVYVRPGAESNG